MKNIFNYFIRKLIKCRRVVLKIVVLFSLLVPMVFLYNYFLQPLNEISTVQSLKSNANFAPIDTKIINETTLKLKEKTTAPGSPLINSLKSPFEKPPAPESLLEPTETSQPE